MSRTVLITGAAGFLAGHLASALRLGGDVRIVGADVRPIPGGRCDESRVVDLLHAGAVRHLVTMSAPSEVYHLVGAVRGADADVLRSNVESTHHLLNAVRQTVPDASVVLVGSAAEYGAVPAAGQPVVESWRGEPVFAYGRAKQEVTALGEAAAREGLRVTIARPFNVIGAGAPETVVSGAIVRRLRDALGGPPPRRIAVGTMTAVRDFVDALDVGEGLVTLARRGAAGESYNLCTGRGRPVSDVLSELVALAGGDVIVTPEPGLSRSGEVDAMVGSPAKAAALGWRAERSFASSLRGAWAAAAGLPA